MLRCIKPKCIEGKIRRNASRGKKSKRESEFPLWQIQHQMPLILIYNFSIQMGLLILSNYKIKKKQKLDIILIK